jgi:hypothetical protein
MTSASLAIMGSGVPRDIYGCEKEIGDVRVLGNDGIFPHFA